MESREPLDPSGLWMSQADAAAPPDLAQVRRRAAALERAVRLRNVREYLGVGVVVVVFACYACWFQATLLRAGSLLVVAGALVVGAWIHRRAPAEAVPVQLPHAQYLARQRDALLRQQRALRSVALGYLGPLVPGLALFLAGLWVQLPAIVRPWLDAVVALLVAGFAGIWWLNRWAAGQLQPRIDELEALLQSLER